MRILATIITGSILIQNAVLASDQQNYWPQWRGPIATGAAPKAKPPTEWSETKNIRWKVEIPGQGLSTPVIWGDRLYIQTAIRTEERHPNAGPDEPAPGEKEGGRGRWNRSQPNPTNIHKFDVIALDRRTGKTAWRRTAIQALPHESIHMDATQSSASPVTDGEHLFAHFGSRGLFCFDMQGQVQWSKNFGEMTTRRHFGEGSSPVLHGDTIVVNWDHEGDSFIVALDKRTGKQKWRRDRDEVTSWSTPIVVEHDGRPQVIVNATKRVRSYDLKTGDVIWECGGQTRNTIPSPVYGNGLVIAMSGFRGNNLYAIKLAAATGDITDSSAIAWKYDKDTPYVPSPLLLEDTLYFLKHNKGILSCFDARNGSHHYTERLEAIDGVYASPVGADNRVYVVGRNGTTVVLKKGPKLEVLATNTLDDRFDASPAIAGNELYLRGRKNLYCIASK